MYALALASLLIPALAFVGYPALIVAAAALRLRPRPDVVAQDAPALSILIAAFDEAAHIGAKVDSVRAAAAAWPGACEILVADDGSGDATGDLAEARGARVLRLPRGGKAAALNRLATEARGAILVMTDADPLFEAGTLPALIAPFADPAVGAVAGRVETRRTARGGAFGAADALFRRYESALRRAEDRLFGCVSADGGLYAIRADLMPHVPPDVTDDFWVSTAAVAAGRRIAWADGARVWEEAIVGHRRQFRRRLRITVRGLTGLWRRRGLMNPARTGWYAAGLALHKAGRRLAPLALLPLPVAAIALAIEGSWFWGVVAAGWLALAGAGVAGASGLALPGPLRIADKLALHLAGLALGAMLFASGRRYSQWTPQKAPAA